MDAQHRTKWVSRLLFYAALSAAFGSAVARKSQAEPPPTAILYESELGCGTCSWEMALAGHPNDPNQLALVGSVVSGLHLSRDGGRSWVPGALTGLSYYLDPKALVTPDGTYLLASNILRPQPVFGSTVAGGLFQGPISGSSFAGTIFKDVPPNLAPGNLASDYPKLAYDRQTGTIYIAAQSVAFSDGTQGLGLFISSDSGQTFSEQKLVDLPELHGSISSMDTTPEGHLRAVLPAHVAGTLDDATEYLLRFDASASQLTAVPAAALASFGSAARVAAGSQRGWQVYPGPEIVIDKTAGGPHAGRIYMMWAQAQYIVDDPAFDYARYGYNYDIWLSYSDDDGEIWSPRLRVNDDDSDGDQIFPSMRLDAIGVLHAAFLDKRDHPDSAQFDVSYALIEEARVSPNIRVNNQPVGNAAGERVVGDYLDMVVAYPTRVYVGYPCGGTSDAPGDACVTALDPALVPHAPFCVGDCAGNGDVTVDEILTSVNIALANLSVAACLLGDGNHDTAITVDEILTAVNAALTGCGAVPSVTPTMAPTPTASPSPTPTSCGVETPFVDPVTSPTDLLQQTITGTAHITGARSVCVLSEAGQACVSCSLGQCGGSFALTITLLPGQTNHLTVCHDNQNYCGGPTSACTRFDRNENLLDIVQIAVPTPTPTPSPSETPTLCPTGTPPACSPGTYVSCDPNPCHGCTCEPCAPCPGGEVFVGCSTPVCPCACAPPLGSVIAEPAAGPPNETVRVPIALALNPDIALATLSFRLTVAPLNDAPALTLPVYFAPSPGLPLPDNLVGESNAALVVDWHTPFEPPRAGSVGLGALHVPVPATQPGQQYSVEVAILSATSDGATNVPLVGVNSVISRCSLLYSGRVSDGETAAGIAGAFVCLAGGSCTRTDDDGHYDGLCYLGQSSAGTHVCATAEGYAEACQGPWTPTGSRLEVNFALSPPSAPTPTPTPTTSECVQQPTPAFTFGFAAEPAAPVVGDGITLAFSVGGGSAAFNLWTFDEDILVGDTGASVEGSPPALMVSYNRTAAHAGTAHVALAAYFEYVIVCPDHVIYQWAPPVVSPQYSIEVSLPSP